MIIFYLSVFDMTDTPLYAGFFMAASVFEKDNIVVGWYLRWRKMLWAAGAYNVKQTKTSPAANIIYAASVNWQCLPACLSVQRVVFLQYLHYYQLVWRRVSGKCIETDMSQLAWKMTETNNHDRIVRGKRRVAACCVCSEVVTFLVHIIQSL